MPTANGHAGLRRNGIGVMNSAGMPLTLDRMTLNELKCNYRVFVYLEDGTPYSAFKGRRGRWTKMKKERINHEL